MTTLYICTQIMKRLLLFRFIFISDVTQKNLTLQSHHLIRYADKMRNKIRVLFFWMEV